MTRPVRPLKTSIAQIERPSRVGRACFVRCPDENAQERTDADEESTRSSSSRTPGRDSASSASPPGFSGCLGRRLPLGRRSASTFSVLWVRSIRQEPRGHRPSSPRTGPEVAGGRSRTRSSSRSRSMLAEFEDRTRRLSIVAGLSAVHDPGTGGVGGLTAVPVDPAASVDSGLSEAGAPRRPPLVAPRSSSRRSSPSQADQLALTPTLAPAAGVLTAGFGARPDPFTGQREFHTGIDISTPAGQPRLRPGDRHGRAGRLGQGLRPDRRDRPRLRRHDPLRPPRGGARRRGPARQARRPRRARRLHGPLDRAAPPLRGARRRQAGRTRSTTF